MKLATSSLIRKIDAYAEEVLNIPTLRLMGLAGEATARMARSMSSECDMITVLCGKGNNGGDGYAAAALLAPERRVCIIDVFGCGQRSEAGRYYLERCKALGAEIISGAEGAAERILSADLIIDAVLGTGFSGELSPELLRLAELINSSEAKKLAVDLPLGISADTGTVSVGAVRADATVALTLFKPAHISYPAKEYMGVVSLSSLGLDDYLDRFEYDIFSADEGLFREKFPKRYALANKGSFGKTLHITGSKKYRGAAHLALEAALRSGVGIVCHSGGGELAKELRLKFPEAIYVDKTTLESAEGGQKSSIDPTAKIGSFSSVLVGCGSSVSKELSELIRRLIESEGPTLIIDADGINSIAKYYSPEIFLSAKRKIVLTPHPLEFSRLCGISVDEINKNRLSVSIDFAKKYGVILLLKGAGTVVTDGERTYINTSGSTALSKGGSGDVLAGLISSVLAYATDPVSALAACAYLHGRAGDTLSAELSDYGVTPSDLPAEIARHIKLMIG